MRRLMMNKIIMKDFKFTFYKINQSEKKFFKRDNQMQSLTSVLHLCYSNEMNGFRAETCLFMNGTCH